MSSSILALDVGTRRIGIALTDAEAGFPAPLKTIINDQSVWEVIGSLVKEYNASRLVVGLPRSLSGNDTEQTTYTRQFISELSGHVSVPIETQDEAVTSVRAEEELRSRKAKFDKSEIDSLAATYILEDYMRAVKK